MEKEKKRRLNIFPMTLRRLPFYCCKRRQKKKKKENGERIPDKSGVVL